MGAYFIRRKSRGALYRKVLARYVQMATEGGVTQAIFPEGGLSLNGKLMPPKMGLLGYVLEAELKDRDVVFVPVAINYDRVLEDRVLIAADAAGTRRFDAQISVILKFIVRKIWLRLRGKFLRFGEAVVVFGTPVHLRDYGDAPNVDGLAQDLMGRIEHEMPLLFVPLLARVLLLAEKPLDGVALEQEMQGMAAELHAREANAHAETRRAEEEAAAAHRAAKEAYEDARLAHSERAMMRILKRGNSSQASRPLSTRPTRMSAAQTTASKLAEARALRGVAS